MGTEKLSDLHKVVLSKQGQSWDWSPVGAKTKIQPPSGSWQEGWTWNSSPINTYQMSLDGIWRDGSPSGSPQSGNAAWSGQLGTEPELEPQMPEGASMARQR